MTGRGRPGLRTRSAPACRGPGSGTWCGSNATHRAKPAWRSWMRSWRSRCAGASPVPALFRGQGDPWTENMARRDLTYSDRSPTPRGAAITVFRPANAAIGRTFQTPVHLGETRWPIKRGQGAVCRLICFLARQRRLRAESAVPSLSAPSYCTLSSLAIATTCQAPEERSELKPTLLAVPPYVFLLRSGRARAAGVGRTCHRGKKYNLTPSDWPSNKHRSNAAFVFSAANTSRR